jgi:hypothetical protein
VEHTVVGGSTHGGTTRVPPDRREVTMPAWLILILVGVVLVILGLATEIGQFLIWIGVIVLVVSLVLGLLRRSRS